MSGEPSGPTLGAALPVMQAAIGRVGDAQLVLAVAAAGGVGTLGASYMTPELLRRQITEVRASSSDPFVVNLILAFNQRERLEIALQLGVPWVSFSWGLDAGLVAAAHGAGARVLVQVVDWGGAAAALDAGADGLIVQGVEAGGHVQGSLPLLEALRLVRGMTDHVVVAAGGICSARAAKAARVAGADVVALGTRFAACTDSLAHPLYRASLVAAGPGDTILTELFDIGWAAPHRVLRSPLVTRWLEAGQPPAGSRPREGRSVVTGPDGPLPLYSMHPAIRGLAGAVDTLPFYAGADVGSITDIETAAAVVHDIAAVLD